MNHWWMRTGRWRLTHRSDLFHKWQGQGTDGANSIWVKGSHGKSLTFYKSSVTGGAESAVNTFQKGWGPTTSYAIWGGILPLTTFSVLGENMETYFCSTTLVIS
jgi:hypothetical protein